MEKGLNVKEKLVFEFIKKQVIKNGYAPTMREICEETGIKSTACVYNHMVSLRKKGYIRYETKRSRTLKILKENEDKLDELEVYKKISEKLAEEMALHGICSGVKESDKCYANEIQCKQCILDWAKKEVKENV